MTSKMFLLRQLRFILLLGIFFWFGSKILADSTWSARKNGFCRGSISVVQCHVSGICELQDLIPSKNQVIALDLSSNSLKNITTGALSLFSGVQSLSLAFNDIQVLTYHAFYGLDNLTTLNLSMNPLRTFTGRLSGLFPSLSTLDATGIVHWKPDRKFLHLRMLQRIIGLTWSAECTNCIFFRNYNKSLIPNVTLTQLCHVYKSDADVSSPLFQFLNHTQFNLKCEKHKHCLKTNILKIHATNICWDEIIMAVNIQLFLGVLSVVFNFGTFLNIVTSTSLRKNVCMMFVCNMAFSDFLTGLYAIIITIYLNTLSFLESHNESPQHCWKIGMFWMLGQASAVVTSFYLTLERYLAIVYSLQLEVRITRRLAFLLILICWLLAAFLTGIALYYNFYGFTFQCLPIRLNIVHAKLFAFTLSIGATALILYGISFGFYVHIYFTVKRAAQDAGVRRESKLAKRIALLVFSNVCFFFVPIFLLGLILVLQNNKIIDTAGGLSKPSQVTLELVVKFFPSLFLSLNSCINPVLHAFRNDSFREVFKERIVKVWNRIRISNRVSPDNHPNPSQSMQLAIGRRIR